MGLKLWPWLWGQKKIQKVFFFLNIKIKKKHINKMIQKFKFANNTNLKFQLSRAIIKKVCLTT